MCRFITVILPDWVTQHEYKRRAASAGKRFVWYENEWLQSQFKGDVFLAHQNTWCDCGSPLGTVGSNERPPPTEPDRWISTAKAILEPGDVEYMGLVWHWYTTSVDQEHFRPEAPKRVFRVSDPELGAELYRMEGDIIYEIRP